MFLRIQQLLLSICLISFSYPVIALHDASDPLVFDDTPLKESIELPNWFKLSFLDLKETLRETAKAGKRGLIIYFHRHDCAYCNAQIEVNWGSHDILNYTLNHFDVIVIDVNGQRSVTDFDGKVLTESDYATKMNTTFTPSMLFYNTRGKLALRLPGFRPPYQFRAALEYVADSHYQREKFADYLARAEAAMEFGQDKMNENDAFTPAPFNFDRSRVPGKRPLVIFFEHPRCHACDVLHADPISDINVAAHLSKFDAAQLNIFSDSPVITPDGQKTTAKAWARQLDLSFAPTLIFFDEQGKEIIRIDSVVRLYRLNNVLNYVLSKGYLKYPTLQAWQQNTRH